MRHCTFGVDLPIYFGDITCLQKFLHLVDGLSSDPLDVAKLLSVGDFFTVVFDACDDSEVGETLSITISFIDLLHLFQKVHYLVVNRKFVASYGKFCLFAARRFMLKLDLLFLDLFMFDLLNFWLSFAIV
jgi:hypothetical protein